MSKKKSVPTLLVSSQRSSQPAAPDALDKFLTMMDDPDDWRTIPAELAEGGAPIKLTAEEIDIIRRLQSGEYADAGYDPYEPYVDFFTGQVMTVPLRSGPEPKRRFIPSKWEALKVQKIVKAIRKGLIRLDGASSPSSASPLPLPCYDMWREETDAAVLARQARHIAAPKLALPHHRESYNPPAEYLLTPAERAEWEAMDPADRPHDYLPQQCGSLRLVPGYARAVSERFSRCLDLLMCPRSIKQKIRMNPDDLLPVLPDPRELRPFPTARSLSFVGHTASITATAVDPTGQWLLSASQDGSVRLWDAQTGHCRRSWSNLQGTIEGAAQSDAAVTMAVAWNPNPKLFLFAVAVDRRVLMIVPPTMAQTDATRETLVDLFAAAGPAAQTEVKSLLKWQDALRSPDPSEEGIVLAIEHPARVARLQWHRRGDYFATLSPEAGKGADTLFVHQLSRRCSQSPFRKLPGLARSLAFHPTRPQLVVATAKALRLYDLVRHEMLKKLVPGVDSLSDLALHPSGDHIVASSHDGQLLWFDLDYSVRPYRALSNHQGAIRTVALHPTYPLMASGGDDGRVQVVHATVYADLSSNPLIVPVKTLRPDAEDGGTARGVGAARVTQLVFHPTQPWLFVGTSTGSLSLFV